MSTPTPEQPSDVEHRPPRRERVRLYRTEAVVLRRRDLGEAGRILTLATERYGKVRAVAKGVRRPKSRLAGHLEPFARTSLLIAQGRNLDVVTQAQLVEPFNQLRSDERLIAYAGYFADLFDVMTVDAQENAAAYEILVTALALLDRGLDPFVTARAYEFHLLMVLGFQPEIFRCVVCGKPPEPVVNGFSAEAGGVLCAECRSVNPQALELSVNALKFLRLLARDRTAAYRPRLSPALRSELEEIMRTYIRQTTERELASLDVLKMLTH